MKTEAKLLQEAEQLKGKRLTKNERILISQFSDDVSQEEYKMYLHENGRIGFKKYETEITVFGQLLIFEGENFGCEADVNICLDVNNPVFECRHFDWLMAPVFKDFSIGDVLRITLRRTRGGESIGVTKVIDHSIISLFKH